MNWSQGLRPLLLVACAMLPLAAGARAQGYPSKPLRMWSRSRRWADRRDGAADRRQARRQARTARHRGKRPGAGGNIGYESIAKSPPDGYSLAFVDPSLTVNPSLYTPARYDAERDFTPISLAVRGPTVMTVPAVHEAKSVAEFVAFVRSKAGKATYGSAGNGTPPHLNAEFFKASQGLDIVHVPYKGAAPAMIDLVAGRIDVMFLNIGSAKGQIESGTLRGWP